jgi:tyrosyl-DNA phosphodiesterase-1
MSIPGTYEGWENMEKWGSCRIGQVVKEEGWKPVKGEKAVVEYQVC